MKISSQSPIRAGLYGSGLITAVQDIETFTEDENPCYVETVDFIEAIREDRPIISPARSGFEAIQVVEAVLADAKR